ncbi:hypothetical protein [Aurantimonas sp. A3-2-R12]|uniref:hypothetical protein n=1 Tax=Aurantimonas sp. A3-2-R12 TaxID=3114362 RepID=UPI002E17AC5B
MTIGEVMGWQEAQDGSNGKGYKADRTYVGAYQIGKTQIGEAAARTGLSLDTKFTPATQDYLAQDLVQNRANRSTRNGKIEDDRFADQLAMEWAGISASTGRSYYDGVAGNKSSVPYSETLGAAKALTSTGAVTPNRGGAAGKTSRVASLPETGPVPTARSSVDGRTDIPTPTSRTAALETISAPVAAPITPSNAPVSAEIREAAARRGVDPAAVAAYADKYKLTPDEAAFALTPQENVAGYRDPMGRQVNPAPAVKEAPRHVPNAPKVAGVPAVPRPTSAPRSQRFATTYLGAPGVPTPTSAASSVPTPTQAPRAVAERSLPDKVLAGAIDVGVGMIPGLGTAASVYGLAAPFLGLPGVGDMALAFRDTNQFDLKESLKGFDPNAGGNSEPPSGSTFGDAPRETAGAPTPTPSVRFGEKYLAFNDPTPRPTPEEKWGRSGTPNTVPYAL